MKSEPMGIGLAVFNCWEYDRTKARNLFRKKFGEDAWKKEIKPIIRRGIMCLFHNSPNKYTLFYAETLARIVNERLGRL